MANPKQTTVGSVIVIILIAAAALIWWKPWKPPKPLIIGEWRISGTDQIVITFAKNSRFETKLNNQHYNSGAYVVDFKKNPSLIDLMFEERNGFAGAGLWQHSKGLIRFLNKDVMEFCFKWEHRSPGLPGYIGLNRPLTFDGDIHDKYSITLRRLVNGKVSASN